MCVRLQPLGSVDKVCVARGNTRVCVCVCRPQYGMSSEKLLHSTSNFFGLTIQPKVRFIHNSKCPDSFILLDLLLVLEAELPVSVTLSSDSVCLDVLVEVLWPAYLQELFDVL